jgi:orotate phosphoribosyltransferase-like protein
MKMTVLDIEENRLSKVISLYSKGLNQEEIAQELHVDQYTVSRDAHFITGSEKASRKVSQRGHLI